MIPPKNDPQPLGNLRTVLAHRLEIDTQSGPGVNYTLLDASDASTHLAALASGESIQTYQSLFPELDGSTATDFNPYVTTSVVLADGSSYRMQYNAYGELAKLILPTGAAYTYEYSEAHGQKNGVRVNFFL